MKCKNCNTEVKGDTKFCPNCGGEVEKKNSLPINFKDKKVIIGCVAVLAVVVLLISSSSKKLTCSMTQNSVYGEYKFTFDSSGKKITGLSVVMERDIPSYLDTDDLDEYEKEMCEDEDINFKSCKVTIKGDRIRVAATASGKQIDKVTDGEITRNTSYDDVKDAMEEMGLTCK